jgi:uncharacterized protein (TIGR00251 family)
MVLFKEDAHGITFKVFIQPRSSKNTIVGLHGDAVKIKLTAPPVDNAANKMCIQYLARRLKVPKSSIEVVSGHSSRTKLLRLRYMSSQKSAGAEPNRTRRLIDTLFGIQKTA